MEAPSGASITHVSYSATNEVAMVILQALQDVPSKYALLGSALVIGRTANPNGKLSAAEEVKFVEDLVEWVNAYFVEGSIN